ncbi:DUF6318 family protein [Calidifontibacter terrae]
MPEPAKFKTDAGAIAFAKYYLETVNKVGQSPKVGVLEALALPSCKTCANQQGSVKDWAANKERVSGPQFQVVSAHRVEGRAGTVVNVICKQPLTYIVSGDGASASPEPVAGPFGEVFDLAWTTAGWRVQTLKFDASASH